LLDAIDETLVDFGQKPPEVLLAGSYPLLTMLAVATAGALLVGDRFDARDDRPDDRNPLSTARRYFNDVIVPEARALEAAARFRGTQV
jgi:hypothetical protein